MPIRVVCENETEYDAQTGTFSYCDHTFTCDDSLLTKVAKCPKCRNPIRVGSSHRHVWADSGQPVADPKAVNRRAVLETQKTTERPAPQNRNAVAPATEAAERGVDSRSRTPRQKVRVANCPACGSKLLEHQTRCPACQAEVVKPVGMVASSLLTNKPVGFHRWVLRTVFASVPPTVLSWSAHGLVAGMMLAVNLLALVSLKTNYAVAVSMLSVFALLVYAYVYITCYRTCHNLGLPLAWWQRLFWNSILRIARSKNWVYDVALGRDRMVLDLRNQGTNDSTLLQTENITTCEVLDLEGCPISDHGTAPLHFLKDLRCLVLKGTYVSQKEIGRLQLSLPQCWIWY